MVPGDASPAIANLEDYAGIVPCGIHDAGVCSLASLGVTEVTEVTVPPGEPPPYPGDPSWQSPPPPPPDQPPGMGGYGGGGPSSAPIPNYLVWSILTTVLCCLPFGIVSIVHAAKVDGLRNAGDIAGAMDASRKAKTWAMVAAGAGLVVIVLYFVLALIIGGAMFAGLSDISDLQ